MKRVLIYGGTTEGRRLAEKLAEAGIPSLVLVATEYGEQMMAPGEKSGRIQVLQGRLTAAEMTALYEREQPAVIVDATHPYAEAVKKIFGKAGRVSGKSRTIEFAEIRRCRRNGKMPGILIPPRTASGHCGLLPETFSSPPEAKPFRNSAGGRIFGSGCTSGCCPAWKAWKSVGNREFGGTGSSPCRVPSPRK